jgi:hypothetical protein
MSAINIDFGSPGTGPDSSYAGAGVAGYWNVLDAVTPSGVGGILDTDGRPTSVFITTSQTMFDVTAFVQPYSPTDQPLLGDNLVSGANTFTMTFTGLEEGLYSVIVYTLGRQDFHRSSIVTPFGDPLLARTNTGFYAGSLQEGVTHSTHQLAVPASGLALEIYSSADGFITGLQIAQVPEPGTLALLWVGCTAAFLRRKFRRTK